MINVDGSCVSRELDGRVACTEVQRYRGNVVTGRLLWPVSTSGETPSPPEA